MAPWKFTNGCREDLCRNYCVAILLTANVFPVDLVLFLHECFVFILTCLFVSQQARAEQEEEFISNTLFKKIQALQKEKETLAVNYEKEEEFLTNELSRKLMQVIILSASLLLQTHYELCIYWKMFLI